MKWIYVFYILLFLIGCATFQPKPHGENFFDLLDSGLGRTLAPHAHQKIDFFVPDEVWEDKATQQMYQEIKDLYDLMGNDSLSCSEFFYKGNLFIDFVWQQKVQYLKTSGL